MNEKDNYTMEPETIAVFCITGTVGSGKTDIMVSMYSSTQISARRSTTIQNTADRER